MNFAILNLVFCIIYILEIVCCEESIFENDIGNQMTIGVSDKGYRSVQLKCGSNSMLVALETEKDFDGVIYTRGNFTDKNSACFLDSSSKRGKKSFSLKFPLDQCNTKKDGETYSNTLVLQHDKELIMPGDVAFHLECDYSNPRDVTVKADLQKEKSVVSRISLVDADPSYDRKKEKKRTVEDFRTVTLTPQFLNRREAACI